MPWAICQAASRPTNQSGANQARPPSDFSAPSLSTKLCSMFGFEFVPEKSPRTSRRRLDPESMSEPARPSVDSGSKELTSSLAIYSWWATLTPPHERGGYGTHIMVHD